MSLKFLLYSVSVLVDDYAFIEFIHLCLSLIIVEMLYVKAYIAYLSCDYSK